LLWCGERKALKIFAESHEQIALNKFYSTNLLSE
jgi:hypothetical protein